MILLPTGAGESRPLPAGPLVEHRGASWFPDGKRVLLWARAKGGQMRLWIQDLDGGLPCPIGPEDTCFGGRPISPDGSQIAAFDRSGKPWLFSTDGKPARALDGVPDGDVPIGWSSDGKALFLATVKRLAPLRISRFDLASGTATSSTSIAPSGAAGPPGPRDVILSGDGKSYVAGFHRHQSDLYVVEGLR